MAGLPIDYPLRNLGRRRGRTLLVGFACGLVAAVLVAALAFVGGLDGSYRRAGRNDVALLLSSAAERDLVRSALATQVGDLVGAEIEGIARVHGTPAVSPEIHMATKVRIADTQGAFGNQRRGFVRGVTERAVLVHPEVTIVEGRWPGVGEVAIGRLVAARLGVDDGELALGTKISMEGEEWRVSGVFAAPGTTTEAEIWAPLFELQGAARRDDVSAVFVRFDDLEGFDTLEAFAGRRLDLEMILIRSSDYYAELAAWFGPIRGLVWIMVVLIALTVVFSGANALQTTVEERSAEIATLRALGYGQRSILMSLLLEASVLAAAGGLVGLFAAQLVVAGSAFRIGMGAFRLEVDAAAIATAFGIVLLLAILGTLPAAHRVLRMRVALALKDD